MVVCKFFQQGYCRYGQSTEQVIIGQSCRFDHIYGSKYTYYAPQNNPQPPPPAQATQAVTDEQLVNQVQSDVQAVLKGGQWILSSYAPFKEKPPLPGLPDLSPEEARLFIYEAKASNNIDSAVAYMNKLFSETKSKYEQLLQPTASTIKILRSLYKGEPVVSPFSNANESSGFGGSNTSATSLFCGAVQNPSVFNQNTANTNNSIFGPTNAFGPASPDKAKSIFAQATQNVFSPPTQNVFSPPNQNVFGPSTDTVAKSIFAQANAFASPPQSDPTNVFVSASQQFFGPSKPDPFGQNHAPPTNVFQTAPPASNVFAPSQSDKNAVDASAYSQMCDLTLEDLQAFQSKSFKLGFVPELPPAKERFCI